MSKMSWGRLFQVSTALCWVVGGLLQDLAAAPLWRRSSQRTAGPGGQKLRDSVLFCRVDDMVRRLLSLEMASQVSSSWATWDSGPIVLQDCSRS